MLSLFYKHTKFVMSYWIPKNLFFGNMTYNTIFWINMIGYPVNRLYIMTSFANPDVDSLGVCVHMADITIFQSDLMVCLFITDNIHITILTLSMAPATI